MAEAAVIEASDYEFAADLDLLQFPDVPADLNLGFSADFDLDFDGNLDFVADLLDFTDIDEDLSPDGVAPRSPSENKESCGNSSSSSVSEHSNDEIADETKISAARSPDSADSSVPRVSSAVKLEEEEEKREFSVKRKKSSEDGEVCYVNGDSISRNSKFRRSGSPDGASSCVFNAGNEEEEKRKVRLMRNRESAQLSRQRKKHYVEELEEKVKSMHSTISELNRKIAFIVAENSTLRQQLNGGGANQGSSNRPAVYPPPIPVQFPWIPYSGYPARPPGAQVPLVPIPRLKQQQVASAPKARKSERKPESKTKKLASVSILGLLFCMLFVGVLVPGGNHVSNISKDRMLDDHHRGRVLTAGDNTKDIEKSQHKTSNFSQNSTKPLLASLYVPRNDKLVKIDGNLIIQSVLASERAIAKNSNEEKSKKETTSLAIAGTLESGRGMERNSILYRSIAEYQRSRDFHSKERSNPASADSSAKEWFQEGLEGPILSSGMCTEVFSFEVAPATTGVVPASASASTNSSQISGAKSRRALRRHPGAIPLPASSKPNVTAAAPPSMVVSVLVDPREVNDGALSSKSISKVFVVVLLDSIKYVTYSCVLPFKNHHL